MRYRVYGVTIESEYPFAVRLPETDAPRDILFELTEDPGLATATDGYDPVYSQGRRRDGRPDFEFYALPHRDVVRITAALDFHCWPDRIACRIVDERHAYLLEIALFGMIMSLWLERRGTPTLHASGAVIGGRAVAFLSERGGGKTSTAAACVASGHPLLTDDLLALDLRDDGVLARPGYPHLRMWPEQARHFVGSEEPYPTFYPGRDKRRVTVGDGFGNLAAKPVGLARLYVPERDGNPDADVVIEPLRPRHAMLALIRHSFLPVEVVRYGLQPARLAFLARVLAAVAVCRLRIPEGLDRLPRVVAAIERDVAG